MLPEPPPPSLFSGSSPHLIWFARTAHGGEAVIRLLNAGPAVLALSLTAAGRAAGRLGGRELAFHGAPHFTRAARCGDVGDSLRVIGSFCHTCIIAACCPPAARLMLLARLLLTLFQSGFSAALKLAVVGSGRGGFD